MIAGMYAVYHGPEGLTAIARRTHRYTAVLAAGLREAGIEVVPTAFFDTLTVRVPGRAAEVWRAALSAGVNLRLVDEDTVGVSCDETTDWADLRAVWSAFGIGAGCPRRAESGEASGVHQLDAATDDVLGEHLRTTEFLTHPVFHAHRSETAMLRYLRKLADRDIALDRGDDPARLLHDEAERDHRDGADHLARVRRDPPLRPAGPGRGLPDADRAAGGLAGRGHRLRRGLACSPTPARRASWPACWPCAPTTATNGEAQRDVCLIPSSAHGTNAASAVMAGMRVVVVASREDGTVDVDDLQAKIEQARATRSPS